MDEPLVVGASRVRIRCQETTELGIVPAGAEVVQPYFGVPDPAAEHREVLLRRSRRHTERVVLPPCGDATVLACNEVARPPMVLMVEEHAARFNATVDLGQETHGRPDVQPQGRASLVGDGDKLVVRSVEISLGATG